MLKERTDSQRLFSGVDLAGPCPLPSFPGISIKAAADSAFFPHLIPLCQPPVPEDVFHLETWWPRRSGKQVDNLHSLPVVLPCILPGLIPSPVLNYLQGSVSTLWGLSGTCLQTQLSPFLWTSSVAPSPAGILSFVCTANTEKRETLAAWQPSVLTSLGCR